MKNDRAQGWRRPPIVVVPRVLRETDCRSVTHHLPSMVLPCHPSCSTTKGGRPQKSRSLRERFKIRERAAHKKAFAPTLLLGATREPSTVESKELTRLMEPSTQAHRPYASDSQPSNPCHLHRFGCGPVGLLPQRTGSQPLCGVCDALLPWTTSDPMSWAQHTKPSKQFPEAETDGQ